ncbi:uncharacterized protein [Bemisia tabaci]
MTDESDPASSDERSPPAGAGRISFTIGHLNKVSEADCKWFHAQESGNGCGGANVVLKWLNWPWPFSLCPDFVQVAIELLDYCLKAADPGGCGNGSDVGAKLRSDSVTSQCWLYGKKKEKEEDKWFSVIVLSLDEAWTKIRHDPNLKTQLPKLTLTFLNFLFNSDWKLSEAVVTLKKVLDDESSKEIDKEQFAVMFCQKLDRWVECYTETQSKLEEDNLLGVIRLMTKLACIFSSEIAEKHFLPRYISFTTHKTYEVRRLCVYKIHEMAYAISESAVETQLLPAFLRLCHDKDSKVRAPCLLGIVALSSKLPMKLRITVLAPVYYRLLDRQNALDNMNLFAAYFPTFCPFITTLAHTPIASLELNQNCDVVLSYLNNSEFGFEMNFSLTSYNKGGIWRFHENNTSCFSTKDSDESPPSKNIEDPFGFNELIQHEEEFKSFQYWREPIDDCFVHPEVIDIMKDKWADNVGSMEDFWNRLNSEETRKSIAKKPLKSASISVGSPLEIYDEEKSKELSMLVSSKLVKAYLPQQRLRWAMNTTACDSLAIYLPPVAFTIGPKNWHLLKSAFNLLAAHEDWKIRAAISTIIHELALMLSKEQTEEDLLPVFKSIMEDLEPVRIGTLSHMASFLGSLNSSARMTFLTRFPDFLCPDFRLREVLVDQLVPVVSLFSACDILTFILPVVILVLQDKIAAVRQKAINLACELSMQVLSYDSKLCGNVLKKFVEHLAMSTEWRHRQTFANLAAPLCINRAAGMNSLSSTVFPQLFNLCNDKVVNVRIATARTLRDINNTSDLRDVVPTREIRRSLRLLAQVDEDPDVRELSLFDWS